MLKTISKLSINGFVNGKGEVCNEDRVFADERFLIVIDGATGLNGIHLTDNYTDAAWLSDRLCELLSRELFDLNASIPEILEKSAVRIKTELDAMGYDKYENSYPSAGVAIARLSGNHLECFSLGDVPVIIAKKDGSVRYICDDALSVRDDKVIELMASIHEQTGCTVAETRQQVNDILLKNRLEMNQEGAYYCFEPTGAGIGHITNDRIPLAETAAIALMSDGFYAALSRFKIVSSREELMQLLINGKAEEILNSLKMLAHEDHTLNRFPRFKIMDDSTVVVAKLQ